MKGFSTAAGLLMCCVMPAAGCGFGHYDEEATQAQVSANDGLSGHGQWWPWACEDGSNPSPQSPNSSYTATGTCGTGGAFAVNVDGCQMNGDWAALGLADVSTTIASSIPQAGGWQVAATSGAAQAVACSAALGDGQNLTVTCVVNDPNIAHPPTVCTSTLAPVNG